MFNKSSVTKDGIGILLDNYEKLILLKENMIKIGRVNDANAIEVVIRNIKNDINESLCAFYREKQESLEEERMTNDLIGTDSKEKYVVHSIFQPNNMTYSVEYTPIDETTFTDNLEIL